VGELVREASDVERMRWSVVLFVSSEKGGTRRLSIAYDHALLDFFFFFISVSLSKGGAGSLGRDQPGSGSGVGSIAIFSFFFFFDFFS
jgi:hypothetical protein